MYWCSTDLLAKTAYCPLIWFYAKKIKTTLLSEKLNRLNGSDCLVYFKVLQGCLHPAGQNLIATPLPTLFPFFYCIRGLDAGKELFLTLFFCYSRKLLGGCPRILTPSVPPHEIFPCALAYKTNNSLLILLLIFVGALLLISKTS